MQVIHAVVVVYNRSCCSSDTCLSLLKQNSDCFDVAIYDNSTGDYGNRGFCQEQGWLYLGGSGNHGLSRAYNHFIDSLRQAGKTGCVCLLDDDTTLGADHFEKLQGYIESSPETDIFLPVLFQNGKIVSPCRSRSRGRYFSSMEECVGRPAESIQAFNSCMTIRLDVFQEYRYDERIFLDGVDHAFLRDMKRMGRKMEILPLRCEQSFSGGQKGSLAGAAARFQIYVRDSRILYEQEKLRFWFMAGKRALHLSLMYRSMTFIRMLLSH